MEQFERIRREHREEEVSIRELARRHGVHRRAVRQALASAVPPPRQAYERTQPAVGPHATTITRWLREDQEAPRKQRHTARRVWERLVDEQGGVDDPEYDHLRMAHGSGPVLSSIASAMVVAAAKSSKRRGPGLQDDDRRLA